MKKLAILGPEGTYCSMAASLLKESYNIKYYPSILACGIAVSNQMDTLLPFENTLDGFIMESLDMLIKQDFHIVEQVKLPVGFHFVGNSKRMEQIKFVYVQYKAYGQCLEFISRYGLTPYITQSNMESLELLKKNHEAGFGAIVPLHAKVDDFPLAILNVADSKDNETRFVRVSKKSEGKMFASYMRASIVVFPLEDRPGLLYSILEDFKKVHLNLITIMSRPRRDKIGNYVFYIEIEMKEENMGVLKELEKSLKEQECRMKIIGIYNELEDVK